MGKFKTNDLIVCIEGTEFLVECKTYRAKSVTIGDDILVWCGGVNKWYADSYFETGFKSVLPINSFKLFSLQYSVMNFSAS